MADIRINALATTATASASDDYLAIDGTANGTRKLSAYSPTFGGTVAVNGAGNIGALSVATTSETALAGPATWSNKHVLLGGVANGTAVTGYAVAVNQSNNDIYTFALAPGVAWRDIRHQAANHYFHNSGSTSPSLTISSTATTLAGNLTVSGTGTSSFAGHLAVGTTTGYGWGSGAGADFASWAGIGQGSGAAAVLTSNAYFDGTNYRRKLPYGVNTSSFATESGSHYWNVAASGAADSIITWTQAMTLNFAGNLLLGTTTDSSNGKLQLATHTTSAGGIGFGTDTSLFRSSNGVLQLTTTGTETGFKFYRSAAIKGQLLWAAGDTYLDYEGNLYFRAGYSGTTALTLDSSQRTILSGALRLNNAYTASVIVPTGYVTIQDSTGTTYKVAVSL